MGEGPRDKAKRVQHVAPASCFKDPHKTENVYVACLTVLEMLYIFSGVLEG